MRNVFEMDFLFIFLEKLTQLVMYRSADPGTPYLTDAVAKRDSVRDLVDNFDTIRAEILQALPSATPIQGDVFFEEDITNDGLWDKLYLKWYSKPTALAQRVLPKTLQVIERHPDIRLAMVSILKPDAVILPHCGPWGGSVRVHLGIHTPNSPKCFIDVDGERYSWRDGEVVAFDDTYEHFVENKTNSPRVILFLDVERKMLDRVSQGLLSVFHSTFARLTSRE